MFNILDEDETRDSKNYKISFVYDSYHPCLGLFVEKEKDEIFSENKFSPCTYDLIIETDKWKITRSGYIFRYVPLLLMIGVELLQKKVDIVTITLNQRSSIVTEEKYGEACALYSGLGRKEDMEYFFSMVIEEIMEGEVINITQKLNDFKIANIKINSTPFDPKKSTYSAGAISVDDRFFNNFKENKISKKIVAQSQKSYYIMKGEIPKEFKKIRNYDYYIQKLGGDSFHRSPALYPLNVVIQNEEGETLSRSDAETRNIDLDVHLEKIKIMNCFYS
jgi:hypothetical protein